MINKVNQFLQTIAMFNFGIGIGTNVCAITAQVWPFIWGISVAKQESVFEIRVGPLSVTIAYQKQG
jgi:hypothetical protein